MEEVSGCRARVNRALAGETLDPLVTGLSFVDPKMVANVYPGAGSIGSTLAAACADNNLDFVFVPGSAVWALDAVAALSTVDACVLWVVDGPFNTVARRKGWDETLTMSLRDPDKLSALLVEAAEEARSLVREGVELGAAAIVLADDLAWDSGPFTAPDFMIAEVIPRLADAVADARGVVPLVLHSDGDIGAFFAPLARWGFDAVHIGGMGQDVFARLLTHARRTGIAVVGGLEGAELRRGLPHAVRAGIHASLRAQAGGLLIADDGGLTTAEEFSAYVTALQSARTGAGGGVR